VSRKITRAVARIKAGLQSKLYLGNLDAKRDWGHAPDYCINKDVPILTPDGWRYFHELQVGDEIINFDPKTTRLDRDRVERKLDVRTDGTRIVLKGRGFFLRCTPEHRILYQQKCPAARGGWTDWQVTTAAEFKSRLAASGTCDDYRLPSVHEYVADDLPGRSDYQLYVLGAVLAAGQASPGRGVGISFSQSLLAQEAIVKRMQEATEGLELGYRVRRRADGAQEWCFDAASSRRISSWYDAGNNHVMPRWCFRLSRRQAALLFGALMDCAGDWGSMTYFSKGHALAADFQTLSLLAGYRASAVRYRQLAASYEVGVMAQSTSYAYVEEASIEHDGPAEAWCVSTKHGTIITRDEDCVSTSGNCEAMWMMLQQPEPDDYVIATGESHTVREFLQLAFDRVGLEWQQFVEIDPRYYRPSEVDHLQGDASKAARILGWHPTTRFPELVALMVDADIALLDDQLAGRSVSMDRDR
jgi:hypothetical protein